MSDRAVAPEAACYHAAQGTLKLTSKSFTQALRSREAYAVLGDDLNSWTQGGCWVLAEAVKKWVGPRCAIYVVIGQDERGPRQGHHVVARIGSYFLDADGIDEGQFRLIQTWMNIEGLEDVSIETFLPRYRTAAKKSGIVCPPAAVKRVAAFLEKKFGPGAKAVAWMDGEEVRPNPPPEGHTLYWAYAYNENESEYNFETSTNLKKATQFAKDMVREGWHHVYVFYGNETRAFTEIDYATKVGGTRPNPKRAAPPITDALVENTLRSIEANVQHQPLFNRAVVLKQYTLDTYLANDNLVRWLLYSKTHLIAAGELIIKHDFEVVDAKGVAPRFGRTRIAVVAKEFRREGIYSHVLKILRKKLDVPIESDVSMTAGAIGAWKKAGGKLTDRAGDKVFRINPFIPWWR